MKLARLLVAGVCVVLVGGLSPAHAAQPEELAAAVADNVMVYVSVWDQNRVAVLDPVARWEVASIPVGASPAGSVFAKNTSTVYVANYLSDNVSVINAKVGDPARNTVIDTIDVGTRPSDIGYAAAANKIYVLNSGSRSISVIRTSDNQIIKTIQLGPEIPNGVAVDDRNGRVYVSEEAGGLVKVFDVATDTLVQTFRPRPDFASDQNDIAVAPDLNRIYVTDGNYGSPPPPALRVVDSTPGAGYPVRSSLELRSSWGEIAINRTQTRAYITEWSVEPGEADMGVRVVNLSTDRSITHIPVKESADVTVDPNGQIYISAHPPNQVAIASPVTNQVIAAIPLAGKPSRMTVAYQLL